MSQITNWIISTMRWSISGFWSMVRQSSYLATWTQYWWNHGTKLSDGKFIRDSFVKTKLPPPHPSQLNRKYPGIFCLCPSIFWIQGWINKLDITPHSCNYWGKRNQDRWAYGCPPIKVYSTIANYHCPTSFSIWRCEATNWHPYSINKDIIYYNTAAKEVDIGKWCNH